MLLDNPCNIDSIKVIGDLYGVNSIEKAGANVNAETKDNTNFLPLWLQIMLTIIIASFTGLMLKSVWFDEKRQNEYSKKLSETQIKCLKDTLEKLNKNKK